MALQRFVDFHGHWQSLAPALAQKTKVVCIHGFDSDWALANPGPIRVDLDSVDFHGIHGGCPWALASPSLDNVDFHGIHMALNPTGWICVGAGKPWPYTGRLG